MATTKAVAAKRKTYDQLLKENLSMSFEIEISNRQKREAESQVRQMQDRIINFSGVVAELEREKAMLQGYIERDLQDKRESGLYSQSQKPLSPAVQDSNLTQHVGMITGYKMPTMSDGPAGITSEGSGYGSKTVKPWYKI